MIKNWLFTGDTHGRLVRFHYLNPEIYEPKETAFVIMGDAGFNYYLDKRDIRMKRDAARLGYTFYCVHGNHEARPQSLETMTTIYDEDVCNFVYIEPEYPNIKYFMNFITYKLDGLSTLVLGGAYSVDKFYRQAQGWQWFSDEQLSEQEMETFKRQLINWEDQWGKTHYDLILSHTCPLTKQPTELFLSMIDQSTVDNSMEIWMEDIFKNHLTYDFHLFGHYHADKIVDSKTLMLYENIISLGTLRTFKTTGEIPEGFIVR